MTEPEATPRLVEMELGRLVLRDHSPAAPQYVYLRERHGGRSFPIVIGFAEAAEMQRVVTGIETERPMTHQLLHDAVRSLGARLARIEIVDLRHNTFFAQLVLEDEAGVRKAVLDARASDSIALALRAKCPLFVNESVLESARTDDSPDELPGSEEDLD